MGWWADIAVNTGESPNHTDGITAHDGVVLHITQGSFAGADSWMRNPAADVSAHFLTARDGRCRQLVNTDNKAWCQAAGNGRWLSIENEGFLPDALTSQQVELCARILARAHREYGVPLQVTTSPSVRGLGHHGMGGPSWGHTACPGPSIIAQKPEIVARAAVLLGQPVPTPAPPVPSGYTGPPWPGRYLRATMRGADCLAWQGQMYDRGWRITCDGIYGPKSASICRQFQAEKFLVIDGIVGPATWNRCHIW